MPGESNRALVDALLATLLGLASLAVYLRTLAPGLTFGDAGDLSLAALQLGVPHPTGYPLYTLLGHILVRLLPGVEAARAMNLFSALCAATTVSLLYMVAAAILRARWAALFAAALYAVTPSFWAHAIVTEVYALHLLLLAATMLAVLRWAEAPGRLRAFGAALLGGLMCAHHLMALCALPAFAAFAIMRLGRLPRRAGLLLSALGVLVPLLLYAYLPWAALRDPPWNWGDPRTPSRVAAHVTGRLYRERMADAGRDALTVRIKRYLGIGTHEEPGSVAVQFPVALLLLAPVGVWSILRRSRTTGVWLLLCYAVPLAWALTYRIRDIEPYFLPTHMVAALWIGAGFEALATWSARRLAPRGVRAAACSLAVLVPAVMAATSLGSMDRSNDRSARHVGEAVLDIVKPNAVLVLSGDAWGFPVAYAHYALGRRPDVVVLLYADFLIAGHRRLIERERRRGVVVPPTPIPDAYRDDELMFLRRFFEENRRRRACYAIGSAFGDAHPGDPAARAMGRVRRVAPGQPVFELLGGGP